MFAITSKLSKIKLPNFQKAYRTQIGTNKYIICPKIFRGYLWADHWDYFFKPCKVEIGTKKWVIWIEIVKIHSGTSQFLGSKKKIAVLVARGSFKK